jgi:hypothetical protein
MPYAPRAELETDWDLLTTCYAWATRMNREFNCASRIALVTIPCVAFSLLATPAEQTTAPRVQAIRIPGGSKIVKAQIGTDGVIHVLLDAEDGPRYVRSTDAGIRFSSPIEILDAASQKPGLKYQGEDLAVGKDGRVHVAMANNAWKLKLPQEDWGFYYSSLAPAAKAFSRVRNINRKPSEGFSLAADERGNVTASFLSGKLYTMASRDHGETFTRYAEPNPEWNPCDCCTTASAYGPDGKLALLYREETDDERDIYVALLDQLGDQKSARVRVSGTPWKINGCPMTYFTVSRTDSGYVAAWPTKGQVYFARLDKSGAVLPPGEIRTPGTSGMRNGLVALSAPDGATLVAWKNKDVLGWQLYNEKAQPIGETASEPSSGGGAAGVVLPNGNFLLFP